VIFDSHKKDGNPRRFTAGRAMPPGVGQALVGVRVGMIRAAVIPAELAFGAQGAPAQKIPPNADLVYEFEVVKVGR
jgi:FKBP-type peptidyl-prolyl cis-trans isomerase